MISVFKGKSSYKMPSFVKKLLIIVKAESRQRIWVWLACLILKV